MSNGRGDGSSGARVVHVHRVFKDNDHESTSWVDVERIDELHLMISGTQRVHYVFDWQVLESDDYVGPTKAIVNPHDENSKIDIPVREIIHVVGPKGTVTHQFINNVNNKSRRTHSRRIYHHEIKDSYLVDGKPPRDPVDYLNSLGNQDKDQFVDVEVIDQYITLGFDMNNVHGFSGNLMNGLINLFTPRWQRKQWLGTTDDPFMNEPLLESDEAGGTPRFMLLYNPDAGPQIDPPWRLDPLQNIVNINWAGTGVIVSGASRYSDIEQIIRYLATKDKDKLQWQGLGVGDFGSAGEVYGAAFGGGSIDANGKPSGNPTFVLVGAHDSGSTKQVGVIMASSDGISWEQVYTGRGPDDVSEGSFVFGVVWDESEKTFWAGAHESENGRGAGEGDTSEINEIDILLRSSDGRNWSEADRTVINFVDWSAGYGRGLLAAHCSDQVKDDNGNGVPDGIYAETKSTRITPTVVQTIDYLFGDIGGNYGTSVKRKYIEDGATKQETIELGITVVCVAHAGASMWVAGGGAFADGASAQSAYSLDDGKTWKKLNVSGTSANLIGIIGSQKRESFEGT